MSLKETIENADLLKIDYVNLDEKQLEACNDAEALYQRGRKLRYAIGVRRDEERGWNLNFQAARQGHPTALATCFDFGRGVKKSPERAAELYLLGAMRGHSASRIALD
jgi:TPR repeat protein